MINDCLGHLAGDELIYHISRRLGDALSQVNVISNQPLMVRTITLARMGGDEFALLLEHNDGLSQNNAESRHTLSVIERLTEFLAPPF